MRIDAVVAQLRLYAPVFGGRVAGAAEFAGGVSDQTWMASPAAYVLPLDEEAGENDSNDGLYQIVAERVGVVLALDNSADRRGQSTATQLGGLRAAVFAALLNWRPDPNSQVRGYAYGGGRLLDMDRGRLFYQWEFVIATTITDDDGWQPPSVPLTEIDLVITDETTKVQRADVRVELPEE
jgi:hypothetical protein